MNHFSGRALFLVIAAMAITHAVCEDSRAETRKPAANIVRLPKSTIETTITRGDKTEKNVEDFIGVLSLPYNTHPELPHSEPPLGYREDKDTAELEQSGKKWETRRTRWTRDKSEPFTNFEARQITIWVSDEIAPPSFRFPLHGGSDLNLPESTVRFEHLPKVREGGGGDDWRLDELVTVTGQYTGSSTFTLGGEKHIAFHYSYNQQTRKTKIKGELWVSRGVPGGMYRHVIEATGEHEGSYAMKVTALEPEELRKDLLKVEKGGFAVAIPKGWRKIDAGVGEVLRLVPVEVDKVLNPEITVEVKPAGGKDYEEWGRELSEDKSKYGYSGSYVEGLGDSPTVDVRLWSGSKSRSRTAMTVTARNDRVYIIAYWQDKIAPRGATGSKVLGELGASWRWLQE